MPERLKQIPDEIWNFIFKTLPFAMAAIAISVAVQVKNNTATFLGVFLSVVIGISCAWITGGFINAHFSSSSAPIIIGVVTIAGEKIGYWLVYKFSFDTIGQVFIDYLINLLKRKK